MSESILNTIKVMLNIEDDCDAFDTEIVAYINSVLFTLSQLGIGPEEGFSITGPTELWSDYIKSETNLTAVQTFIKLKVQLLFDPPSNSFVVDAINKQIDELGWRLCLEAETLDGDLYEVTQKSFSEIR